MGPGSKAFGDVIGKAKEKDNAAPVEDNLCWLRAWANSNRKKTIYVHTSLMSRNKNLEDRFMPCKQNEVVPIFVSNTFSIFIEDLINWYNTKETNRIFLQGPSEIGKSCLLALLVWTLRTQSEKYRVVYINRPKEMFSAPWQYFKVELYSAFSFELNKNLSELKGKLDVVDPNDINKTLSDVFDDITKNQTWNSVAYALHLASIFAKQSGVKVWSIQDQEDDIEALNNPKDSDAHTFYTNFRNTFDAIGTWDMTIIAGSNNRTSLLNKPQIQITEEFNPYEIDEYLTFRNFKEIVARTLEENYDKCSDLVFLATDGHPLRLHRLLNKAQLLVETNQCKISFPYIVACHFKEVMDNCWF